MSDEFDTVTETIEIKFTKEAQPVADFEDASAYTDHKDDPIMWSWEFTRRTHEYQIISDLTLLAESCETEKRPIPLELRNIYRAIFDAYRVDVDLVGADIMERPASVRAALVLVNIKAYPLSDFRANWRRSGYWQHPEGPPDDLHTPHLRSHQSRTAPWATAWPGMADALSMPDEAEGGFPSMGLMRAIGRGVTVGGGNSFQSRRHYETLSHDDPTLANRAAHFAFDLSLPIEWQLNVVRDQLAFMQRKAVKHGFVGQVAKAKALPGVNGVLMLRCLDADADERNPNDSRIMRVFGWEPSSSRTRFKRLRNRAMSFRDELAPKLCELRA